MVANVLGLFSFICKFSLDAVVQNLLCDHSNRDKRFDGSPPCPDLGVARLDSWMQNSSNVKLI